MDEGRVFFNLLREIFSLPSSSCFERSLSNAIPRFHGGQRGEWVCLFGSSPGLAKFTARKAIDFNSREANSSLSLSLCLGGRDRWYNGEGKGVAKWP